MRWRRRGLKPRDSVSKDGKTPLVRLLLQHEVLGGPGAIYIAYDQQWKTLVKAQRLGLVDENQNITPKGREYLLTHSR